MCTFTTVTVSLAIQPTHTWTSQYNECIEGRRGRAYTLFPCSKIVIIVWQLTYYHCISNTMPSQHMCVHRHNDGQANGFTKSSTCITNLEGFQARSLSYMYTYMYLRKKQRRLDTKKRIEPSTITKYLIRTLRYEAVLIPR